MATIDHATFRLNVREHKGLLKTVAGFLTEEIRNRGGARGPDYLDFRFLLPLSQWLVEQGGYTMTPRGNNPGNVMFKGDNGRSFIRMFNVEDGPDGKPRPPAPAEFAEYVTMESGRSGTFNKLMSNWPGAYVEILTGGSPELYVMGLYPGVGKNYATRPQGEYLSGMRLRLSLSIQDFLTVTEDDLKECDEQTPRLSELPPEPDFDAPLRPGVGFRATPTAWASMKGTDLKRDAGIRNVWISETRPKLEAALMELKEIEKRLQRKEDLQP